MSDQYSIGQMAAAGNCKVQTIRYYEEVSLLPPPRRTPGNQRIYGQTDMDRLFFIRHGRELGFSLDQIREMLGLGDDPAHRCEDVDAIARIHLQNVESKINRLNALSDELKRMLSECAGGTVSECRILKVLSDHKLCLAENHRER